MRPGIRATLAERDLVLLDYEANTEVYDLSRPLSRARHRLVEGLPTVWKLWQGPFIIIAALAMLSLSRRIQAG